MDLGKIGLRIKNCRRERRLTQEEFAEMIEVSPHYIYEIERGSKAMSIKTLNKIVIALEVSADYLLYGDVTPLEAQNSSSSADKLTIMSEKLSPKKRESVAEIINAILPYLK